MSMTVREIANAWPRKRAADLRAAAAKSEQAYQTGPWRDECHRVAKAYREAASVLEAAQS